MNPPPPTGVFLTAEWRRLAMVNYLCPPELLAPLVPRGTELDAHGGRVQVSLVGFLFLRTRVLGLPIPFHCNFEELNLRFYVKRQAPDGVRRGVVFVKEIVPRFAIAAVARAVYNENYVALPMRHRFDDAAGLLEYDWKFKGAPGRLRCVTAGPPQEIPAGSDAEFITEHDWGYARRRDGGTTEYAVEHPRWRVRAVKSHAVSGDLSALYGDAFGEVLSRPAVSAFVAEGSPVLVRKGVALC